MTPRELTAAELGAALALRTRADRREAELEQQLRQLRAVASGIEPAVFVLAHAKDGVVKAEDVDSAAGLVADLWAEGGPMPPGLNDLLDAALCRVRLDRNQPVRPRHLAALAGAAPEDAERDLAWVTGRWTVTAEVGRVWLATRGRRVLPPDGRVPMDSRAIGEELPRCLQETGLLGDDYLPWPLEHDRQIGIIRRAETVFRFTDEIVRVKFIRIRRDRRPQMVPMTLDTGDRLWEAHAPGDPMVQVR